MNITQSRIDERKRGLIRDYSAMGFNYHSVIRLDTFKDYSEAYTAKC